MAQLDADAIIDRLWAPDAQGNKPRIFAILDGARDQRIVSRLRALPSFECQCLFAGRLSPKLQLAAPYLVRLYPDRPFTRALIQDGWGNAWGIFCSTDIDIDGLRLHFKKLLWVRDESGRRLYFRFYDPRVLRIFLPTCTREQREQIFGLVSTFLFEDEDGEVVTETPVPARRPAKPASVARQQPGATA